MTVSDISTRLKALDFSDESIECVLGEKLLPPGIINRLVQNYPQYHGFEKDKTPAFRGKIQYVGKKGFREILTILQQNGIEIGDVKEREFFIDVYRFMATRHILNCIDWKDFENDPLYHLIFPQPGMIARDKVQKYLDAGTDEERQKVVEDYQLKTNPHDGKQKLNKPFFYNEEGQLEIVEGCQHKYPPIKLVLDAQTQNCFAFCTYCFRHAQVRGDEDMFAQRDVAQVHNYLKLHKEITDVLITGGDGGYISLERLKEYVVPIVEDNELAHIRNFRIGSRALTFHPEYLLTEKFREKLELLRWVVDNGIQVIWMGHFSSPRELMNPGTLAAIRRLKNFGITVKSQSPVMNRISLFKNADGSVDVERSAQNWIDLGNILAMLGVGFHSMYCPRPTGEHRYFSAPLADINKVFSRVYRSLASVNRPSRYITMTSSAGKTSLMGTAEINGEKVFVLKFNESRNMEWMDRVYFARYDEKQRVIEKLEPFDAENYFYEEELEEIESRLEEAIRKEKSKSVL